MMLQKLRTFTLLIATVLAVTLSGCEKESLTAEQEAPQSFDSQFISQGQVAREIENPLIKEYITGLQQNFPGTTSQRQRGAALQFNRITKGFEYTTYSLLLNEYTVEKPYYLFFIVKKQGATEQAGFSKYIPDAPTAALDVARFTGVIELYTVDDRLYAQNRFTNGRPVSQNDITPMSCTNNIRIVIHNCSHSGTHGPGESCYPGYTNDAYYEIIVTRVCTREYERITPPDSFGGQPGGGGGGPDSPEELQLNAFVAELPEEYITVLVTHTAMIDYLRENNYSQESKEFIIELIALSFEEANQRALHIYALLNMAILIDKNSDRIFEDDFIASLDPYMDIDFTTLPPDFGNLFGIRAYLDYRRVRRLNPEWSRGKCALEAGRGLIHLSLDVFGLIPVVGEAADLVNGALYTIEGDGLNATLSYASAVPIVGWATAGTKFGLKVVNVANDINTRVKLVWKLLPNGNIYFGGNSHCRATLRKVLGMTVGDGLQAHHIIPLGLQTNPIVQRAAKSSNAFHMNEAFNGIPLGRAVHNGSHGAYDRKILEKLNDFTDLNPNATPNMCYDKVTQIIQQIRTAILNNPNTPINQLNF